MDLDVCQLLVCIANCQDYPARVQTANQTLHAFSEGELRPQGRSSSRICLDCYAIRMLGSWSSWLFRKMVGLEPWNVSNHGFKENVLPSMAMLPTPLGVFSTLTDPLQLQYNPNIRMFNEFPHFGWFPIFPMFSLSRDPLWSQLLWAHCTESRAANSQLAEN